MAVGSAGVMFGASDTCEGIGDISASITGEGLDQRSYNPIRDDVFGGNELVYAVSEMGVSLTTSALASKVLTNSTRATTDGLRAAAKNGVPEEAEVAKSNASKVWDYSERFEDELINFNPGYEIRTSVNDDLYLVQFHSGGKVGIKRSLKYWTTTCEANNISTIEEYMNRMSLLKEWGARNYVTIAKIPAGTKVKYAMGTAFKQPRPYEFRPGGGLQLLFEHFDETWILKTAQLP